MQAVQLMILVSVVALIGCNKGGEEVIVYATQDQVYSEPILRQFERETGIRVRAVYDSEAVKTVGLANRLLAERSRPQCDVFWNNEELRTHQLIAKSVLESNSLRAFGYRSRCLVVNTNQLAAENAPRTLTELTNAVWKGKFALAYPLFGTTATHFLALRQRWGHDQWLHWCRTLRANAPFLVDGNSVVVNLVGRGEAWIGLTDFDDIAAGLRQGLPIHGPIAIPETLLIPNTVALVRNGPNSIAAERLAAFLSSSEVIKTLIAQNAVEGQNAPEPASLDFSALLRELDEATTALKEIFAR